MFGRIYRLGVCEFLQQWNHQKVSFPEMHRNLFSFVFQIANSKFWIWDEILHHTICLKHILEFLNISCNFSYLSKILNHFQWLRVNFCILCFISIFLYLFVIWSVTKMGFSLVEFCDFMRSRSPSIFYAMVCIGVFSLNLSIVTGILSLSSCTYMSAAWRGDFDKRNWGFRRSV